MKNNSNKPLITIVVPVYNTIKYLENCLDSISRQTFKQIEVLLMDDGSSDGSEVICDEYANRDNRFVAIHHSNKGLSATRNTAIKRAKGDYILFVDSDDHIALDLCEKAYLCAKSNSVDLIRFFYQENTRLGYRFLNRQSTLPNEVLTSDIEKLRVAYTSGAMVWKFFISRDLLVLNNLKFLENIIYEDMDFTTRLALSSKRMIVLPETLYFYRIRLGSISWLQHTDSAKQCEKCCNRGIAFAMKIGASNDAIGFLVDQRNRMTQILSLRTCSIFNKEYPKEVFYD